MAYLSLFLPTYINYFYRYTNITGIVWIYLGNFQYNGLTSVRQQGIMLDNKEIHEHERSCTVHHRAGMDATGKGATQRSKISVRGSTQRQAGIVAVHCTCNQSGATDDTADHRSIAEATQNEEQKIKAAHCERQLKNLVAYLLSLDWTLADSKLVSRYLFVKYAIRSQVTQALGNIGVSVCMIGTGWQVRCMYV